MAYTGLLQLFLTPQALHLLVVDMPRVVSNIENNVTDPLEDLGALRWVRSLSYRVPGAAVILVGTKCDLVEDLQGETAEARMTAAAAEMEQKIRSWVIKWTTLRRPSHRSLGIAIEEGVSLVNCGLSCEPSDQGWPCDVGEPSLLRRITHNGGVARRADPELPVSWGYALSLVDEVAQRMRWGALGCPCVVAVYSSMSEIRTSLWQYLCYMVLQIPV